MGWNKNDYIAAALICGLIIIAAIVGLFLLQMAPGSHPLGWFLR